jgi:hypothetical protein
LTAIENVVAPEQGSQSCEEEDEVGVARSSPSYKVDIVSVLPS